MEQINRIAGLLDKPANERQTRHNAVVDDAREAKKDVGERERQTCELLGRNGSSRLVVDCLVYLQGVVID